VSSWFDGHLRLIRSRADPSPFHPEQLRPIGAHLLGQLRSLDRHFRISDVLADRGVRLPVSAGDRVSTSEFEAFGNASAEIRRRLSAVDFDRLEFACEKAYPSRRRGSDVLARAEPGSRRFTICMSRFDPQGTNTKTGVVLHEAFHATFFDFDHDTYSMDADYPGHGALTNAESYAMFAANIATGASYRLMVFPDEPVQGRP